MSAQHRPAPSTWFAQDLGDPPLKCAACGADPGVPCSCTSDEILAAEADGDGRSTAASVDVFAFTVKKRRHNLEHLDLSVCHNGYQWSTLSMPIASAGDVADGLRAFADRIRREGEQP